jgi:hypothetical protein
MFTIDITLKGTPLTLSVERKESADAEALYSQLLKAMQTGEPTAIELTCDRQTEKKVGILSSQISAIQVSDKSNPGGSGKPPGFWQVGP